MAGEKKEAPALEREDLAHMARQSLEKFFEHPPAPQEAMDYGVRISSGTTGGGLLVGVHTSSASLYRRTVTARWYEGASRVLCCFPPIAMRLFTVIDGQKFTKSALYLNVDPRDFTADFSRLAAEFASEKILGVPSYVLRVAPYCDEQTRARVLSVNVFGEFLTEGIMQALHAYFPSAVVNSLYALSELGALSTISCGALPPNWYHPRPGVSVAIDQPDETGAGELLVSVSLEESSSVVRYRTGDSARLHDKKCSCGEHVTFELLGRRGYDYLKIAGAMIRREECDRVMHLLKQFDDYRIEASSSTKGGALVGRVVLKLFRKDGPGTEALAREIAQKFSRTLYVAPARTLADFVEAGAFTPLEAAFVSEPFPSGIKDTKLVEIR